MQMVLQVASETLTWEDDTSEDEWQAFLRVHAASMRAVRLLQQQHDRRGRGVSPYPQLPTLSLPRSDRYNQLVVLPDKFQQECAFSPAEFDSLYGEVESVLLLCRDLQGDYGTALNCQRRRRRYKYGPRERLFIFLCFCRQYGGRSFRRMANNWNWSVSSVFADFIWLRENLICLPALSSKLRWGTPQERETQRLDLIRAGVCIFPLAARALADSLLRV